ncbi:LysM peptidoglycan-binding domain-containing protein [Actinomyces sp. 432]|uniref:LysM peptidoglycan-binding domain-containing protein n=1 Tax=Actinomyces sp. 432 TaxID=2057798 RepID=UPI001F2F6EC6|nr:LysM domain-containing protein [Actinomyces sp. 432]
MCAATASTRTTQTLRHVRSHVALGTIGVLSAALIPVLASTAANSARSLLELPTAWWGSAHLTAAITALACTAGALGALWHLLSVLLALAAGAGNRHGASAPGNPPSRSTRAAARALQRWGAPLVRRITAGVLVAGITTSPALAAPESEVGTDDLGWQPTVTVPTDPDAAAPSSPPSAPAPDSAPDSAQEPGSSESHTVAVGESLWSITAELLGPQASPAQIADAWPRLYQANTQEIGTDPGLIHPGTDLDVPTLTDQPNS